jgi:hypothetical protein
VAGNNNSNTYKRMKSNVFFAQLFVAGCIFVVMAGCSNPKTSSDYMVLDDIQYTTEFPQTFMLDRAVDIDLEGMNIIGLRNFCIYDSLLILSVADKEGAWSFLSLSDCHFLGKFLSIGQGPDEFLFNPEFDEVTFFEEKGVRFACIYDSHTGKLHKMNIDKSIRNNKLSMSVCGNLSPSLFDFCVIDSVTFFCKEIINPQQQTRYIWNKGKKIISPHLGKLNFASTRPDEDINVLSTITLYDFFKGRIVEANVSLNYINLYSLDGSFGKTICIGDKLDNIDKIQNIDRWDRIYTFGGLCLFPQSWGVLYINESDRDFQGDTHTLPAIFLFDWDGNPLAEFKLNRFITSFDIDMLNGYLYTFDHRTDEFCKYNIRDILEKL